MKIVSGLRYTIVLLFITVSTTTNIKAQQDLHRYDPPWNTPPKSSVEFTIKGINNVPDLYGDIVDPQLVVFFAGNQFMCIDDLLEGFKKRHPHIERIFAETLPPGILAKQIEGESLTIGNLRITHKPDVYTAGKSRIDSMANRFSRIETYAYNKLSLMVPKGNPKKIKSLADLQSKKVRVSMPNPVWEGIGRQIEVAYKKAGGEALHQTVMQKKVTDGSTFLTRIHHRESPLRILLGNSDVAPVWTSEVVYQKMIGNPVEEVEVPQEHNIKSTYRAGRLKNAPRPEAADLFIEYLISDEAKAIYKKYGFEID
ncbi:substrate-binding domain-containing protein [Sphingobacterium sp. UT-1RO-CII-1]|uniref:molybdate ABC transporter substrate-binding protein n=1 Tax=Sphingobacterium sp. UT-1RO-CII-1 TaxID=2995225 RepID=UPI00227BB3C4|nr:substrate-binding domain-containing protein [Sphingobacterium sp. UT-1RO-CII-1]MCY4778644.1 substrate-binding domain-containing protein [Sphingobacterium sp. UT-1RO-CII-1]